MKDPIEALKDSRKAFCLSMAKSVLDSCRNTSPVLQATAIEIAKKRIKEYWRIKEE